MLANVKNIVIKWTDGGDLDYAAGRAFMYINNTYFL